MGVLDQSSCDFTRKFEDSERLGTNLYARKRHTLMVSFVATRLGSSVAETSRPWLLQDREKIKTTLVCISSRFKTSAMST